MISFLVETIFRAQFGLLGTIETRYVSLRYQNGKNIGERIIQTVRKEDPSHLHHKKSLSSSCDTHITDCFLGNHSLIIFYAKSSKNIRKPDIPSTEIQ